MQEYVFVPNLDDDKKLSIRVCSGEYEGTVFTINAIQFQEDEEGPLIQADITYELVVVNKKPKTRFKRKHLHETCIDDILADAIKTFLNKYKENKESEVG